MCPPLGQEKGERARKTRGREEMVPPKNSGVRPHVTHTYKQRNTDTHIQRHARRHTNFMVYAYRYMRVFIGFIVSDEIHTYALILSCPLAQKTETPPHVAVPGQLGKLADASVQLSIHSSFVEVVFGRPQQFDLSVKRVVWRLTGSLQASKDMADLSSSSC